MKKSVDKAALQEQISSRDYNMALHFSKRLTMALDPSSKARSFANISRRSAGKMDKIEPYFIGPVLNMYVGQAEINRH